MAICKSYKAYFRNSACLCFAFLLSCAQINAVEPINSGEAPSPQSAKAVRTTLIESTNTLNYYPLIPAHAPKKTGNEELFHYAENLWAAANGKVEFSDKQLELIRKWFKDDNNFNDAVEKRCKPGTPLGLHFLLRPNSSATEIKGVVDFTCASLRFYDAQGSWITGTYFDPSVAHLENIFKLSNSK